MCFQWIVIFTIKFLHFKYNCKFWHSWHTILCYWVWISIMYVDRNGYHTRVIFISCMLFWKLTKFSNNTASLKYMQHNIPIIYIIYSGNEAILSFVQRELSNCASGFPWYMKCFVYECRDRATTWEKFAHKTYVEIDTLIDSRSTIVYGLRNYYTIQCITSKQTYGRVRELKTCQQTNLLPMSSFLRAVKNLFLVGTWLKLWLMMMMTKID